MQVIGEYELAEVLAQGRSRPEYSIDLAMRKDFLKHKKANLSYSIGDVFNTLHLGSIYDTDDFYQDDYWRGNVSSFRLFCRISLSMLISPSAATGIMVMKTTKELYAVYTGLVVCLLC